MMQAMQEVRFPVSSRLAGSRHVIHERLRGTAARGMFRATVDGESNSYLVTVGTKQTKSHDEIRATLVPAVPGIVELRHIGPVAERERDYDAMVEDEPPGQPSSALSPPLPPTVAIGLALGVCVILRQVHGAGAVLKHVRPELIYTTSTFDRVTGMAPRAEEFLSTAIPPSFGVPPMFDTIFIAPEVSAKREVTPLADVFALAGVLAFWLTGEHPFVGNDAGQQLQAMHADRRRAWTGPAALEALVTRALSIQPARRPSVNRLEAELRAFMPK